MHCWSQPSGWTLPGLFGSLCLSSLSAVYQSSLLASLPSSTFVGYLSSSFSFFLSFFLGLCIKCRLSSLSVSVLLSRNCLHLQFFLTSVPFWQSRRRPSDFLVKENELYYHSKGLHFMLTSDPHSGAPTITIRIHKNPIGNGFVKHDSDICSVSLSLFHSNTHQCFLANQLLLSFFTQHMNMHLKMTKATWFLCRLQATQTPLRWVFFVLYLPFGLHLITIMHTPMLPQVYEFFFFYLLRIAF